MSLKKEIVKNNILLFIGKTIAVIFGFMFSIILARTLQPYYFGLFSFCLILISLSLFFDFGMNSMTIRYVANYLSKGKIGKIKATVSIIFKYKIIIALICGLTISLFSNQIATSIFNKPEAGFIVFFSGFILILQTIFLFLNSLFSGLKDFKSTSLTLVLEKVFNFIFVIGLVLLGLEIMGAIFGLIIAYISLIFVCYLLIRKKHKFIIKEKKSKINKKALLKFGFWLSIGTAATILFGLTDQLLISILSPIEDIGYYRIGLTWMVALIGIIPITADVAFPYLSGAKGKVELDKIFFNSLKYISIFIFPLGFLLSAFSLPLVSIFYSQSFLSAVPPLKILALVSIPMILSMVLKALFISIKKPKIRAKVTCIVFVFNIFLCYFLLQFYGIVGAAIALLLSNIIELGIFLFISIFKEKLMFKISIFSKPLMASLIIYYLTKFFIINNIIEFIFYSLFLISVYIFIMVLIRGITKEDFEYARYGALCIIRKFYN